MILGSVQSLSSMRTKYNDIAGVDEIGFGSTHEVRFVNIDDPGGTTGQTRAHISTG
jgi:hypothetical protein